MTYLIWLEDGDTEKKYIIPFNPEKPPLKETLWWRVKRLFSISGVL
jgi:hypothetical protein